MKPQKPSNSSRHGPEIVERQRVAKERQRVRSCTVQYEMKGVLERMLADGAKTILDSREIKSLTEDYVRCSKVERGNSKRDEGVQIPQWKPRVSACQKI